MAMVNITRVSVNKVMDGMFAITLNLTVTENSTILIDSNFTENHKINNSISYTVNKFKDKMQKYIDDYKANQQIFNSSQLNSAMTSLRYLLVY